LDVSRLRLAFAPDLIGCQRCNANGVRCCALPPYPQEHGSDSERYKAEHDQARNSEEAETVEEKITH